MSALRGVGARLSLALALVVLAALGIAYAMVVPRLERNLADARLRQLVQSGSVIARSFQAQTLLSGQTLELQAWAQNASVATGARVAVVFPLSAQSFADAGGGPQRVLRDRFALQAALTGVAQRGEARWGRHRFVEAAFPEPASPLGTVIILFSAPLEPTLANVELVKRRVLVAGVVALVVALGLGYGGAWLFARRLRRLERAADRIAGGRLDEPVVDRSRDEVGQLARAFERMRGRLAQLEHARREFIANASHELRTPLFSLGGFLELLADEDIDEPTRREFLATMQEQVGRLTRLAADLLDLSRLDAGRLHVDREAVDLGDLAGALAQEFSAVARATGHDLERRVETDAAALGDELHALRIGRVLVENALRHTPAGSRVTVLVRRRADAVELAVADDGPGIAPEHAPHVFDRFYRADGGMASGSGLGLAIARELAGAMDGSLDLESRPGRTEFSLRLHAAEAEPAGAPPGRQPAAA